MGEGWKNRQGRLLKNGWFKRCGRDSQEYWLDDWWCLEAAWGFVVRFVFCDNRPSGVFPERRFVSGFFWRLCAYIIPCISISIIPYVFRIPSIRAPSIYTYRFNAYPVHTFPGHMYPFNTYASAGMAMNVNTKRILAYRCISRNGNECECETCPCFSLHQQEWQWVSIQSLHVISYHFATRREWQ